MNFTNEQLEEIQELAALLLEPEEIAVLMNIDVDFFFGQIEMRNGAIYAA